MLINYSEWKETRKQSYFKHQTTKKTKNKPIKVPFSLSAIVNSVNVSGLPQLAVLGRGREDSSACPFILT